MLKNARLLQVLGAFVFMFLFSSCRPNVVTPTIDCNVKTKLCTATVTNEENRKVDYEFKFRYEPQGMRINPNYRYPGTSAQQFDHWNRVMSQFFSTSGTLNPHETVTYTTNLPDDFDTHSGQSLLEAYVHVAAPNDFSVSDAEYSAYSAINIPGYVDRPITYSLSCSNNVAEISITNNGTWGDRDIAIYLNEELSESWQMFHVKSGETITVTTNPFPSGVRLVEADVNNHQEASYKDAPGLDYHGSRGYCIPNIDPLILVAPTLVPTFNPENQ